MQFELGVPAGSIPYWSNWVGAWAIDSSSFAMLHDQLMRLNIQTHLAASRDETLADANDDFQVVDGIAVLNLSGPMMKHRSSFGSSVSTVEAKRAVLSAKRSDEVRGMVLKIDSPGGTVAGTNELAQSVAEFGKPTMAFCSDMTASAAYWVASQCDTIAANKMALVGSIGTYTYIVDSSRAAENAGVKVNVIHAGEFKGAGVPGAPVEEKHLQDAQRLIDQINSHFLATVAEGRKMSSDAIKSLADGRVHMAADAMSNGLIDQVASFEQAFEKFASSIHGPAVGLHRATSESPATETGAVEMTTESKAITPAELKDKFPNATAEWRFQCLDNGWTQQQCVESYAAIQEARAEAAEEKLKQQERAAEKPGTDPVTTSSASEPESGDAVADWESAVAMAMKATNGNRQRALSIANRKNPGLREAMLAQHNAAHATRI